MVDERVVGDATDRTEKWHNSHRMLDVPLKPVVAHLTITETAITLEASLEVAPVSVTYLEFPVQVCFS